MIDETLKNLIEENALAIATANKKAEPHCIGVGFVKVVSKNQILITDNYMNTTVKNILENPKISLVVWNKEWKDDFVGYKMEGTAEYFKEGKWLDKAKKIPENKGMPCKGTIVVTLNKIVKIE